LKDDIKYIFFDCMETIVDLYELPVESDYALWAFSGSGVESYWNDFDEFLMKYLDAKREHIRLLKPNQEYEMMKRLELVVARTDTISSISKMQVTKKLHKQFWTVYKSQCYVSDDIKRGLPALSERYKLAAVSNFMIQDGIEELLQLNEVNRFFDFVVTSIRVGWRKPSPKIYQVALHYAGCTPEQILFIGDDYENDYLAPRRMNMKSLFFEREYKGDYTEPGIDKINNFNELQSLLLEERF
jgi:putative hydrolase of the HAD superfamily